MNDLSPPKQTIIYYSKNKALKTTLIMIALLMLPVYLLYSVNKKSELYNPLIMYLWAILLLFIPILVLINSFKRYFDRTPQIVISDNGIQLNMKSTRFLLVRKGDVKIFKWGDIGNETVTEIQKGKNVIFKLTFISGEGEIEYILNSLDTNQEDLNYLLTIYRDRSEKKSSIRS